MGAWDTGNFSNDIALDYIAEVTSISDIKRPINAVISGSQDYIDADLACEALAAADLLAAMIERPATDLPKEVEALLSPFSKPSTEMLTRARTASAHILKDSGLAELWNEDDGNAWTDVIDDLLQRLDPEIPYEPQPQDTGVEGGFVCSICERIVPDDQLISIEIGFPSMPGITMGQYFHRSCIEANFKPPYFSKQGEVEASLQEQVEHFLHKRNR